MADFDPSKFVSGLSASERAALVKHLGTSVTVPPDGELNPRIPSAVDDQASIEASVAKAAADRAALRSTTSADRRAEAQTIGDETRKTIRSTRNRGYNTPADFDSIAETRAHANVGTDWFDQRHGNAYPVSYGVAPAPNQSPDMAARASMFRDIADTRLGRRQAADTATASGLSLMAGMNPGGGRESASVPYGTIGVRNAGSAPVPAAFNDAVRGVDIPPASAISPKAFTDSVRGVDFPPASPAPVPSGATMPLSAPLPRVTTSIPSAKTGAPIGAMDRLTFNNPVADFRSRLDSQAAIQQRLRDFRLKKFGNSVSTY